MNSGCNIRFTDGTLFIALVGEIDRSNTVEIKEKIDDHIYRLKPKKIVIDFSNVSFMDASSIGLILGRYVTITESGGQLVISNPNERAYCYFRIASLDRMIHIENIDKTGVFEDGNLNLLGLSNALENVGNEMKIELQSYLSNVSLARTICKAFCLQLNPTAQEVEDVACAVSEAVTNCVVHAYPGAVGKIYIAASVSADRTIRISIKDKGCGIEDVVKARQLLFTTKAEQEHSGMGFNSMEICSDVIKVKSKIGKGTEVILIKQFI